MKVNWNALLVVGAYVCLASCARFETAPEPVWRLVEETDPFTGAYFCFVEAIRENYGTRAVYIDASSVRSNEDEAFRLTIHFSQEAVRTLELASEKVLDRCRSEETSEYLRSSICNRGSLSTVMLVKFADGTIESSHAEPPSSKSNYLAASDDSPVLAVGNFKTGDHFANIEVTPETIRAGIGTFFQYRLKTALAFPVNGSTWISEDAFDGTMYLEHTMEEGMELAKQCSQKKKLN